MCSARKANTSKARLIGAIAVVSLCVLVCAAVAFVLSQALVAYNVYTGQITSEKLLLFRGILAGDSFRSVAIAVWIAVLAEVFAVVATVICIVWMVRGKTK